jgi:hypothetical protein
MKAAALPQPAGSNAHAGPAAALGIVPAPVVPPPPAETAADSPPPTDSVQRGGLWQRIRREEHQIASHLLRLRPHHDTMAAVPTHGDIAFQTRKRFFTDLLQIAGGDATAMLAIGVDFKWLPWPEWGLFPLNAFNFLTGAWGIGQNLSVVRDCVTNEHATRGQKAVDVAEFINNLTNTGASILPAFMAIHGPFSLAGALFAGGQVLGMAGDIAKLIYDKRQGGSQSGHADGDQPHKLVMDRFEKRLGRLSLTVGALSADTLVFPHSALAAAIPAGLSTLLIGTGAAIGSVYAFTQIKKSKQFIELLQAAKEKGITDFRLPDDSGKPQEVEGEEPRGKVIQIDDVIATLQRRKWGGYGQLAASVVIMAAGCAAGSALAGPLAVAGLGLSAAVGVGSMAAEAFAHRKDISDKLEVIAAQLLQALARTPQKVKGLMTRLTPGRPQNPPDGS